MRDDTGMQNWDLIDEELIRAAGDLPPASRKLRRRVLTSGSPSPRGCCLGNEVSGPLPPPKKEDVHEERDLASLAVQVHGADGEDLVREGRTPLSVLPVHVKECVRPGEDLGERPVALELRPAGSSG